MVELLKQGQFMPYDTIDQCISIFTASKGFLDDLEISSVGAFEAGLLEQFRTVHKDLRDALSAAGSFKKIDTDAFEAAIADFKAGFTA